VGKTKWLVYACHSQYPSAVPLRQIPSKDLIPSERSLFLICSINLMCEQPDFIELMDSSDDDERQTTNSTSDESFPTSLPVERTRYKRKSASCVLETRKVPSVFHHDFEKQQERERQPGVKIRRVDAVSWFPVIEEDLD
jgi:hypothetical protein